MKIRPIRTHEDHRQALAEIDRLWGAQPDTEEGDVLEVLIALVERFEDSHFPVPASRPAEVLRFMMDQNGRTQTELAQLLGSKSRASELLNGGREPTLDQIRLLAKHWRIPAGALIGELDAA